MSESDRVVERWTTGHISPAEHGGFVAYGDYLTLKRELLQAQQDAARYRWLRNNPAMLLHLKNGEFDAAIDAAMSAKD